MCTAVKSYRKPTGSSPYKGNTPPSHPATQPGLIHYANKATNPIEGTSWVNVVSLQNSILPKPDKSPTYLMIPWIWEQIWADESVSDTDNTGSRPSTHAFRRQTHQSPYLDIMYSHHPVRVTFDSGATGNKSAKLRGSSTKLRGSQWTLLPCEIEALAITVATKHFSPYLVQSHYEACILTKSKPCIQAYEKTLQRRVSSKPPCIYLSVHREPLSGFCKTRIWLCNTTFRFLAVQLRVTIKPARSVPSQGSHRILLSDARNPRHTQWQWASISRSPVALPGWPHRQNVPIYEPPTNASTVSRCQASVRHVSGSAILPSDFSTRSPAPCEDKAC